jgi:cell division protein FtsB
MPQSNLLAAWLKANFIATAALTVSVVGAIYGVGHYVANSERNVSQTQADIRAADLAIVKHQTTIDAFDRRIIELSDHVTDLHNQSNEADAAIRARLDVIDALSRYAAERATQPNIPSPYQPPGPGAKR